MLQNYNNVIDYLDKKYVGKYYRLLVHIDETCPAMF